MHLWPAAPTADPTKPSMVLDLLASGITTIWFFAPAKACTLFKLSVPVLYMYCPTGTEPTKDTALMSGWTKRASTCSFSPWIICNRPGGAPASENNSANLLAVMGSCSEGFKIKVFPHAIAMGNIHKGIIAGKLKGVMPVQTPKA